MELEIPSGDFLGYIFDCDGTLADNMDLHYRAWSRVLAEAGGAFPLALYQAWAGRTSAEIIAALNLRFGLSMDVAETRSRKERYYLDSLGEVEPVGDVVEIVRRMHGQVPMAVASGGQRRIVAATLAALGIRDLFDAVVCAEDYRRAKPAPDPFLEAARRLGVPPASCLVFEDASNGIAAAKAAGMSWVLVPTGTMDLDNLL